MVDSLRYRLNQYGGDWMQGYNVLSDEKYREVMFDFDLQLFGGGGGGGKSGGKILG